jgi:glutamine amidotransferase
MKKICLVDYGLGNIKSLYNAIKYLGYNPFLYSEKKYNNYDLIIIPGVGSFSKASNIIMSSQYSVFIKNHKDKSIIFGICLGMHLLLDSGTEFGSNPGLSFISGKADNLKKLKKNILIPLVGFQEINMKKSSLKKLNQFDKEKFYFSHSYYANIKNENNILATTTAQKTKYCCAVIKGNIIGTQFHPEKSGETGLDFIKEIINI